MLRYTERNRYLLVNFCKWSLLSLRLKLYFQAILSLFPRYVLCPFLYLKCFFFFTDKPFATELWSKFKDISSDKSGSLVQSLMGIDGHLQRTSFFTEVKPTQKEWWHFDRKLRYCGKANISKKQHLGSCSNACSFCLRSGARFIFLWRHWLEWLRRTKYGCPFLQAWNFNSLLGKKGIEFLSFCENKTNWLLRQWYWLALGCNVWGCNVWADWRSCKICHMKSMPPW